MNTTNTTITIKKAKAIHQARKAIAESMSAQNSVISAMKKTNASTQMKKINETPEERINKLRLDIRHHRQNAILLVAFAVGAKKLKTKHRLARSFDKRTPEDDALLFFTLRNIRSQILKALHEIVRLKKGAI